MLQAAVASGERLPAIVEANYLPPQEGEEGYDADAQAVWDAFAEYGVASYLLLERGGVWYAVFGLTGIDSDACAPMSGMVLHDIHATAQQVVDAATAACLEANGVEPMVICLSHSGTDGEGKGEDYELAQAVEGTVQTLQQNARQKDDFVAAFTHELKTPMTSILGFADILRSGEVSPATRRTAADYIYHESKRLEALSGNLLALMGLEQQPPQLEAVPLGRVLQSLRRALPQGSPVPTLPRSDAVVLAQPELLCDMLYNLIQNARKATPADGKVEVLLDETPTRLTIRVQDTGCGIPPQELARITEPFYMVDKSRAREQGGSGMGLALCARIAALHGTTLQFTSVPSQGTTVSFCLQKAGSQPEVEP